MYAVDVNQTDSEEQVVKASFKQPMKLANLLIASQRYEAGMDQLLELVQRDRKFQDDIGRKTLLDVFNLLSGQGELALTYRRKLYSSLN